MTTMQKAVHDAYFFGRMKHHEIADLFGVKRPAITRRLSRMRLRFAAVGQVPPLNPGSGLRAVTPTTLYPDN
ncbi:MAG: hypothetical protein IT560_14295 [Alphaproteobacteria bacterium]|nr:hypothetical protein [Alphaproteobacteria bacterium]